MSNNVIDFTTHWLKREIIRDEIHHNELDSLHDISTMLANDTLNILRDEFGIETDSIECAADVIFFFEAFKGLVMHAQGEWHPFQDMAKEFFEAWGIQVIETPQGYQFKLNKPAVEDPANDG